MSKRLQHLLSVSGVAPKNYSCLNIQLQASKSQQALLKRVKILKLLSREKVYEETGLQFVEIENYLGCFENELEDNQRIIAETTQVYIEPNLSAIPYKRKLPKGLTINYLSTEKNFTHISYIEYEYDKFHKPIRIDTNITGWIPNENLSAEKKRHFFLMSTQEKQRMRGN